MFNVTKEMIKKHPQKRRVKIKIQYFSLDFRYFIACGTTEVSNIFVKKNGILNATFVHKQVI